MKTKINDEVLEKVSGGAGKSAPNGLLRNDTDDVIFPAHVMSGTAVCPVCGKRYDPQYPHICNVK